MERWQVLNEDESYLVSSWGRFYSLKTEQFIKPYLHKSRCGTYLRVNIGRKKFMVHVLVAIYFVLNDSPETKTQVEHDDNNTLNPNCNNIRWVTPSENQRLRHLKNKRPIYLKNKKVTEFLRSVTLTPNQNCQI